MLNEIFIADEPEVMELTERDLPLNRFEGIYVRGIDPVKLAKLYSIVSGVSFETALDQQVLVRAISEDDGPWISKIPDGLRDTLAAQTDARLLAVSQAWANAEEFKLDRWSEENVNATLLSIAALARNSKSSNKQMFLWSSL